MRALIIAIALVITSVSFAEVSTIKSKDAVNLCAAIRELYTLQKAGLAQFPLAQVVRIKVEGPQQFSLVLGNEDEYVACSTENLDITVTGNDKDTVKIVYNPEVSDVSSDRVITGWSYAKAYNISGALADNICAQLEMFDVVEDQAQIPSSEQVLFTLSSPEATNIFGIMPTVFSEKSYTCGSADDVKVFQIPSIAGW